MASELDSTQKKLRSVIQMAEKAKLAAATTLQETIEEMKRKNAIEWEKWCQERKDREKADEAAQAQLKADEAERVAREAEITIQKRVNEIVARTTALYESKFNEMRSELMTSQRTFDDLTEQHRALQEWQKNQVINEANWNEIKKSMQAEIEQGKAAAKNVQRYQTILKYMTCQFPHCPCVMRLLAAGEIEYAASNR